jgi:hypothetical protein
VSDPSNPVMIYLKARSEFLKARGEVVEAGKTVQKVSTALQTIPPSLFFSDCEVGVPVELGALSTSSTASARDWRSADELQRLVNEYCRLRGQLHQAWNAVPHELREGLEAPNRAW